MSAPYDDQLPQGAPGYPMQPGHYGAKVDYAPPVYPGMSPPPDGMQQGIPGQAYPPPPPPQGQQQHGTTAVVIGAPVVTVVTSGFREVPVSVVCPTCQQTVVTRVSYEVGTLAWLICGGLVLLGCFFLLCWLGFCLIPFCVKGCKDVRHTCPNCNSTVGVYRRM